VRDCRHRHTGPMPRTSVPVVAGGVRLLHGSAAPRGPLAGARCLLGAKRQPVYEPARRFVWSSPAGFTLSARQFGHPQLMVILKQKAATYGRVGVFDKSGRVSVSLMSNQLRQERLAMRNFTCMGFIAVSAAFLSIAAQSAASAQVNPVAEGALKSAAQGNPIVERYVPQLQKKPTKTETALGNAAAASAAAENAAAAGF
jgi:hypothetical protein